jgi:hypothetical protein
MFNRLKKPPVEFANEIAKIRQHVKSCKKLSLCLQCQKPWYDGMCECTEPISDCGKQKEVAMIAYRLMSEGVDPDKYL